MTDTSTVWAPCSLCAATEKTFWALHIQHEVDGLRTDCVQGVVFLDAALCHLQHQFLRRCLSSTSKMEQ